MATKKDAAPTGSPDNPLRVATVPPPADGQVTTATPALTPAQQVGLDPVDPQENIEQTKDRDERSNRQTDHELAGALDPVSGGPTPGITQGTPLTGVQTGQHPTDESGRPPLSASDEQLVPQVRDKLRQAMREDKKNNVKPEEQGFRSPQDLGVPGAVMKRILESGAPLETATMPNGHFFPETGTRYRLK